MPSYYLPDLACQSKPEITMTPKKQQSERDKERETVNPDERTDLERPPERGDADAQPQ
jgi:hypothetical protein